MRMLRCARGKTRLEHIRSEDTRKEAHVKPVETFLDINILNWFGLRRERNHICAKSLRGFWEKEQRWRDNIQGDMTK